MYFNSSGENMTSNLTFEEETVCSGTSDEDLAFYHSFSWWVDGWLEVAIGVTGILANSVTIIPLLASKKMASIFNRLLVCLAMFDNLFLVSCMMEAVRRYFIQTNVQVLAFIFFFYQLQSISLVSSTTTTVVLAVERYLAVTRPVEYHLEVVAAATAHPWRRVMSYMIPTIVFSVLINLPKFFELEVYYHFEMETNITRVGYKPTELRMNKYYSLFYIHLVRLIFIGIIPFASLVWLNRKIYCAVRRSRRDGRASSSRRSNDAADARQEKAAEERRRAIVLFVIVIMFLLCNTPRIILNFYEFFSIDAFRKSHNTCHHLPLWVMVMTSVSLVLMTINSSINFFIYCLVNATFRQEMFAWWRQALSRKVVDDQNGIEEQEMRPLVVATNLNRTTTCMEATNDAAVIQN